MKKRKKEEYETPQAVLVQVPVENGFSLSSTGGNEDSNIESFGDSGNNYGNELF